MESEGSVRSVFSTIEEALEELRAGRMVVVCDDESEFQTAFTVSVDARRGITTGISAADRAEPIRETGGILERSGQTEAAVDLARMAGLTPAGVICEVMNDNGTMARVPDLERFCQRHGICMITVASLIAYRREHDRLVERVADTHLPTAFGDFRIVGYRSLVDTKHHLALVKGDVGAGEDVLVRMHSECLTGDAFGSLRCDCGEQLMASLNSIEAEGRGVLVYLAQEGRGIGLLNKLMAYELQEQHALDTVDANLALGLPVDLRTYGVGAQILIDLGLHSVRLLTNNPKKTIGLQGFGISVTEQVPIVPTVNAHNERYLRAKVQRLGHVIHDQATATS
jgi:3,4-dihydroxy 2-butanone 4-phosphate synthase / GTP cyclohydrolase II